MPFEGEFAKYQSVKRLAMDRHVEALQRRCKLAPIAQDDSTGSTTSNFIAASSIRSESNVPNLVVAIDGSYQEVPLRNGYPGAQIAYLSCAAVILDMEKIRAMSPKRPVDPQELRRTQKAGSVDAALPSKSVILDGCSDEQESFRQALFELLECKDFSLEGVSLLETYEAILANIGAGRIRCPYKGDGCEEKYAFQAGRYSCLCAQQRPVFSTDWLRIHEGLQSSPGAAFTEVMQVVERLQIVHLLRYLERSNQLSALKRLAIMVDGPLAMFGHPAELKDPILAEIRRITKKAASVTDGIEPMIIGIEKSGAFTEHFIQLDTHIKGGAGKLANGSLLLLTDEYIKKNIVPSTSPKEYGRDTYFGRKFFYKTSKGHLLVASVPFLKESARNIRTAEPDQFSRLGGVLRLLDELSSCRYPNSLTPLIAAHAEAAIPLNLGSKILRRIAEENITE